jgi:two-component system, OmpR family, response regulator MprA
MTTSGKQILVVDDDRTMRETLGEVLADEGYLVETAADGHEALERLRDWSADLVILDVMMPVMDAFAFRRELARRGTTDDCAVLVVSAAPNLDQAARRLDATDAIAKPFSLDALLGRVESLLSPGGRRSRAQS